MNIASILILSALLGGCETVSQSHASPASPIQMLQVAAQHLYGGEVYEAKQKVRKVLSQDPKNKNAQELMAEILEEEIRYQKETETRKVLEEYTDEESANAVKTWLERGRSLFELKQYEQAILAVERVFLYDPDNIRASELIDQIRDEAQEEGKGQSLIVRRMYREEIGQRVKQYLEQSRQWVAAKRWGPARLTLEKILLLDPENKEANKLYEEIQNRQAKVDS